VTGSAASNSEESDGVILPFTRGIVLSTTPPAMLRKVDDDPALSGRSWRSP